MRSWRQANLRFVMIGICLLLLLAANSQRSQGSGNRGHHKGHGAGSEVVIKLKNDFIEKYKNRVTIAGDFNVDVIGPVHPTVKGGKDGDVHFSGRSEAVQLPIVAEIMNAKEQTPVVDEVKDDQGKPPVKIAGAWRLWCEHANTGKQDQGSELDPFDNSNPDHVFEIHPVTHFADHDVRPDIKQIPGYQYYDAPTAFTHYAAVTCKIEPGDDSTTIRTHMAGYNYVEFLLESLEDSGQHLVIPGDGRILRANVLDSDEGELVARDVRMCFIEGTTAEEAVRTLGKNKRLHVAAIPRIDLALVSWRAKHANDPQFGSNPLNWNLPYEMIIVGVLSDQ
jgi:hypothetical protein